MTIPAVPQASSATPVHYVRFTLGQRLLHAVLVITFLGLAATGLPMHFNKAGASMLFANAVGGFAVIIWFHKVCAVTLTLAFLVHVGVIGYRVAVHKEWKLLWGRESLVPNLDDVRGLYAQMKWFLFLGPKPKFDRFTYWEKFDYWAVFWGMFIIGLSGYAMWFAPLFARLVPGSWLNVALLVHGEEALLAVSFIFLVHFFNEHLRPDNFPMDVTIFTGAHTEEELRDRHSEEFEHLQKTGELKALLTQRPSKSAMTISRVFGAAAVVIGLVLLVLTIQAFLTR